MAGAIPCHHGLPPLLDVIRALGAPLEDGAGGNDQEAGVVYVVVDLAVAPRFSNDDETKGHGVGPEVPPPSR